MKCPYCGSEKLKVLDSRAAEETSIRRRRQCEDCGNRFTTYETIETVPLMVIKKDESREQFDRDKLINGILRSTYKRPVSFRQVEALATEIEALAQNSLTREIHSSEIGEMVMERLKAIDEVSYVRFASVYREFKDVVSFMAELRSLIENNSSLGREKKDE